MIRLPKSFLKKKKATPKAPKVRTIEQSSGLECKFHFLWNLLSKHHLEKEYKFHPVRKWRFDYAHPKSKIAIEIEGINPHRMGRHQTLVGYSKDCEKYNQAQFMGWKVYRLTQSMLTEDWVLFINNQIR